MMMLLLLLLLLLLFAVVRCNVATDQVQCCRSEYISLVSFLGYIAVYFVFFFQKTGFRLYFAAATFWVYGKCLRKKEIKENSLAKILRIMSPVNIF